MNGQMKRNIGQGTGKGYGAPCPPGVPPSEHLHVLTNVEAPQTLYFRHFYEAT